MSAHITVNGTPLCEFPETAVVTQGDGLSVICGHASLRTALDQLCLLALWNPDRDPTSFAAASGPCPSSDADADDDNELDFEAYAKSEGSVCPLCAAKGTADVADDFDKDDNGFFQLMICSSCCGVWQERFQMTGIAQVEEA